MNPMLILAMMYMGGRFDSHAGMHEAVGKWFRVVKKSHMYVYRLSQIAWTRMQQDRHQRSFQMT